MRIIHRFEPRPRQHCRQENFALSALRMARYVKRCDAKRCDAKRCDAKLAQHISPKQAVKSRMESIACSDVSESTI
jgi:hypothetical protein